MVTDTACCGGLDVAGYTGSGFNSWRTLAACGSSDGKEVKDVFIPPGVGVGSTRLRPLGAHGSVSKCCWTKIQVKLASVW